MKIKKDDTVLIITGKDLPVELRQGASHVDQVTREDEIVVVDLEISLVHLQGSQGRERSS